MVLIYMQLPLYRGLVRGWLRVFQTSPLPPKFEDTLKITEREKLSIQIPPTPRIQTPNEASVIVVGLSEKEGGGSWSLKILADQTTSTKGGADYAHIISYPLWIFRLSYGPDRDCCSDYNQPQSLVSNFMKIEQLLHRVCIQDQHTTQTIRNKYEKLEGKGEASFDTPFMTQSHAESVKKIV